MILRLVVRLLGLLRPFGAALAIFIFLNLALALVRPSLSATRVWLYLSLEEPILSAIAGILGLVLLLPASALRRPAPRNIAAGVIGAFLVMVLVNIAEYYRAASVGLLETAAPVPFSAFIFVILLAEISRLFVVKPVPPLLPPPARWFFRGISTAGAFFLIILAHIVTFGLTDYSTVAGEDPASAVVVLGARVYPNGEPSPALAARLETGVRLYLQQKVGRVIMSGGVEPGGLSEPRAMARWAMARGVPESAIVLDEGGMNTYRSALGCGAKARELGIRRLLVVSQSFHLARVKLIFERVSGVPCFTVPAAPRQLEREAYFLFRETIAFPWYFLFND